MKRVALLLITVFGTTACDNSTVLQVQDPDATEFPVQFAQAPATRVDVTAIIAFEDLPEFPTYRETGVVTHERGGTFSWSVTGDLIGSFTAFDLNFLWSSAGGKGHGSWVMELTAPCEGRFSGNWQAVNDPWFNGKMLGQGEGGCDGKTLKGEFWPVTPGNDLVQNFAGTLHSSNAKNP